MKFNVPTKLCFLRIIFAIVIIILLLFPFYRFDIAFPQILYKNILIDLRYIIAGIIFIFASITDYFDGRIARKRKEVTNFGKMIDAIADKILVNSVLIIFATQGFISPFIPVIIIVRDIIVDAIKLCVAKEGTQQAAIFSGKLKTASLMIGMVLTFFYNLPFELIGIKVSSFFLYFGTIMSLISMYEYYKINKKVILSEFL
ncbi:MAG: CDP-diacylglycerol--glycerol-3-phosphate 3-phosphatidyltransferase [bacterium]|nr:CDP-diacylglycerol--glycerol-3-phosphate 3-phosphatidyltransferase [bacterium]